MNLSKILYILIKEELDKSLTNPDSVSFIDKVKKENPDKVTRYRTLIANRGLDFAKQDYVKIDPDTISKNKEKDKSDKRKKTRKSYYDKNKERLKLQAQKRKEEQKRADDEEDEFMFNAIITEPKRIKELCRKFVGFLPSNFPEQVDKITGNMKISSVAPDGTVLGAKITGKDDAYYILLGHYMAKFEDKYKEKIPDPIENEDFYDELDIMMYGKFGDDIEF